MDVSREFVKKGGTYKKERRPIGSDDYEQEPGQYEYILEGGNLDSFAFRSNMFRRQTNPLYLALPDDSSSPEKSCKSSFLLVLIVVFILSLVSLAVSIFAFSRTWKLNGTHVLPEQDTNVQGILLKHKAQLENLIQVELTLEKELVALKRRFEEKNNQSTNMNANHLSRCLHKSEERGNSASTSVTLTEWIPPMEDIDNWVVTGVACFVDGGLSAMLHYDGKGKYQCNCTGHTSSVERYCRIHYWYCPKT